MKLIQDGKPVARGTLQTVFVYTPFDEVRRLGLRNRDRSRDAPQVPEQTGMLVVSEVQRGSPAEGVLEPGDILVRINGELIADFDLLAQVLDDGVGKTVKLEIERGGRPLETRAASPGSVCDHASSFLEFGDAVVHDLSWQQARHINVPIRGVYVANPGYVFGAARHAARRGDHRGRRQADREHSPISSRSSLRWMRASARRCASSRSTIRAGSSGA